MKNAIKANIQGWREWLAQYETALNALENEYTPLNHHNAMELLNNSQAHYFSSAKILEKKFDKRL